MSHSEDQDEKALLIQRAVLGEQVHVFLNTDIGSYMLNRSAAMREDAIAKLRGCDPEDANAVRKFQNEAWLADSVKQWLVDAIQDGLQAINIIDDRES